MAEALNNLIGLMLLQVVIGDQIRCDRINDFEQTNYFQAFESNGGTDQPQLLGTNRGVFPGPLCQ